MKNIRSLNKEQLLELCEAMGEKKFRANQLWEWIWQKSARSFDEMTNLSKDFRAKLATEFSFPVITIANSQKSADGTIKYAFRLDDGFLVEGVLIPTSDRVTACISSQVGCSLSCTFCATGFLKRERNLRADEMYDQVAILRQEAEKEYGINLSNIVLMGMGEPLLNYVNVMDGMERVTAPDGLGMSPQRITLSTAGIAKMIKQLGDDDVKFNLALSLHAATDAKRSEIMPINDSNTLEALSEALIYFHEKTGSRVTFEYIIFKDFNDSLEDAKDLAAFAKIVPCKINIIEYNTVDDVQFLKADPEKTDKFAAFLENTFNLIVNVRRSRGKDIDAACGQLANTS